MDESIAELREAIQFLPNSNQAHIHLGVSLAAKQLLDEAIVEFKIATRLLPKLAEPHNNLGFALKEKGQMDEAIVEFREAIRIKPDYLASHIGLAWVLAARDECSEVDAKEAIVAAQKAVELSPKDNQSLSFQVLGWAYYRNRQHQAAIESLNKSIELQGDADPWQWFFLAMAHYKLGETQNAPNIEPAAIPVASPPSHRVQAHDLYRKAVDWMEKNKSNDRDVSRFRAEAASLLGPSEAAEMPNGN